MKLKQFNLYEIIKKNYLLEKNYTSKCFIIARKL